MAQLFTDAARTTLASGISDTATTLTVALGDAFPVANTGTGTVGGATDWFKAVLDDGVNIEIVYVRTHTAASETFDNVLRGQDGTAARTWSAGAVVGLRWTALDASKVESLNHLAVYAVDPANTPNPGLTLGYKGGRWGGFAVTASTVALTASSTNYVVVNRSTGAVSVSTAATNWDDQATYARVYKLPTTVDAINWATAEDHRSGPGGVHGQAVNAGGLSDGDYGDIVVSGGGAALNIDSAVLSTFGRNLIDDPDAASARTTLGIDTAIAAAVAGLSWKQAVRAATTAAGTLASSFANGSVIDGVTLATGDRILIKNQAAAAENGIYVVAASGAPTRATDADAGAELVNASVYVSEGTTLADTQWTCSTNAPITVGSTSLTFVQLTSGGGGLSNWTDSVSTAAPNSTTPVAALTATNAASNVDAAIIPKGTGALLAAVPDSAATGGNKRGTYSVDWQMVRTSATHVTSGAYAVIGGGRNNVASAQYAIIAGGYANTASNINASILGGESNTANGQYSAISGGASHSASASFSFVGGGQANTASGQWAGVLCGRENVASGVASMAGGYKSKTLNDYSVVYSGIPFAAAGDAQQIDMVISGGTTNATPKALTADQAAQATGNQLTLENNSAMMVRGQVVARQNTTGDTATWEFTAAIKRGANAAATSIIGTPTVTSIAADAGASAWTLAISADTTRGALAVTFTGEASKTIRAVCRLKAIYVQG